jgi:hypothetical protein
MHYARREFSRVKYDPRVSTTVIITPQSGTVLVDVEYRHQPFNLYAKLFAKVFLIFFSLCLVAIFIDEYRTYGLSFTKNDRHFGPAIGTLVILASAVFVFQKDMDLPENMFMTNFLREELKLTPVDG